MPDPVSDTKKPANKLDEITEFYQEGEHKDNRNISLRQKLEKIIDELPTDTLNLEEIRDMLGRDGMLLLVVLLTVVFLIPVSIPGVSTIFGATILLIGVSIMFGWNLWLPKQFLKKQLPSDSLRKAFSTGLKWFTRLEKVSKPHRLMILTEARGSHIINGFAIVFAAILLMFPFGFIPFSNTFPAIALLFYAIGLLQKDGVSIVWGHVFSLITLIYFGILLFGGGFAIMQIFNSLQ